MSKVREVHVYKKTANSSKYTDTETLAQKHAFQNVEDLNISKGFLLYKYIWFVVTWNALPLKKLIPSYSVVWFQEKQHISLTLIFLKLLPCA